MTINATIALDDGTQNVSDSVSSSQLAAWAASLSDTENHSGIFDILSRHDDSAVREAIAGMSRLPDAVIRRLAVDPALAVAKDLLRAQEIRARLTAEEVLAICRRDPELAASVAGTYEDYVLDDDAVIDFLENHPDCQVRANLADNPFVPKAVLRRMAASDPDAEIRESARVVIL